MPELTVAEVARIAQGEVEGDGSRVVRGVKPLDEAGPGDLSFVAEPRYFPYIAASQAAALLVARGSDAPLPGGRPSSAWTTRAARWRVSSRRSTRRRPRPPACTPPPCSARAPGWTPRPRWGRTR
jgi:hypothetical protein